MTAKKAPEAAPIALVEPEHISDLEGYLESALGEAFLKLTSQQRALLVEVFAMAAAGKGKIDFQEACKRAKVSYSVLYTLKSKGLWDAFLKWVGRRALEEITCRAIPIARKVAEQAMAGKSAQQKMALTALGLMGAETAGPNAGASPVKIVKKFVVQQGTDGQLQVTGEVQMEQTLLDSTNLAVPGA